MSVQTAHICPLGWSSSIRISDSIILIINVTRGIYFKIQLVYVLSLKVSFERSLGQACRWLLNRAYFSAAVASRIIECPLITIRIPVPTLLVLNTPQKVSRQVWNV